MTELNTKLLQIISCFGVNNQQRKLQEEIFELQEAIIKQEKNAEDYKLYRCDTAYVPDRYIKDIKNEMADVLVLLKQVQLNYGIKDEDLLLNISNKTDRTIKRIKEGYYK